MVVLGFADLFLLFIQTKNKNQKQKTKTTLTPVDQDTLKSLFPFKGIPTSKIILFQFGLLVTLRFHYWKSFKPSCS